jgi:hypothetical protein
MYKTPSVPKGDACRMVTSLEPVRFDTKIAVLLHEELASWQALNVTAFLVSGIAASDGALIGEPYVDGDGTAYLPMVRQPILIFSGDSQRLTATHGKALSRHLAMSIYTRELFATGNDRDNRAAVRGVNRDDLDLVGIAVHGPRNAVDKALKGAPLHA